MFRSQSVGSLHHLLAFVRGTGSHLYCDLVNSSSVVPVGVFLHSRKKKRGPKEAQRNNFNPMLVMRNKH